jgi:predicted RND superfamily exporter protein
MTERLKTDSLVTQLKSRLIASYVSLSARRPGLMLFGFAVLTLVCGLLGGRISVDPRLEAMLPTGTKSALANQEARKRFASVSPLYLVVQSSDPTANRQVAQRALEEVRKWPETLWAIDRRDPSYFLDRRLLYLDAKHLDEMADEVEVYLDWQACDKMPACVNFEDEPPEPDFGKLKRRFEEMPELAALTALFGKEGVPDPEAPSARNSQEKSAGNAAAPSGKPQLGELCSSDGKVCVVEVTIDGNPQDLEFATQILHRGEAMLASLEPKDAPADMITAVTGVYRNLPLTREAVMTDLSKTFGLTLALVTLVLALQFRFGRAFILLLTPLIVGTLWALGVFALVSPTLNVISAAVLAVLAGLGDEFSQHLITHFSAERREGKSATEAILATLDDLLSSMGGAALTTGVGFLALTAARFHGFVQMGLLAFVGVLCIALATLLVMPPLVLWLDKQKPFTEPLTRNWKMPKFMGGPWKPRPALLVAAAGIALLGFGIFRATRLELEYNFDNLEAKSTEHGTSYGKALHGTSRNVVLMLADNPAALEEAGWGVRRLYPDGLKGVEGASVITPGTFVPPDQPARLAAIERLRKLADKAHRLAKGDVKERLDAWRPLLAVDAPIEKQKMPKWVFDQFAERNGTFGTIGVLYQGYRSANAHEMIALSDKLDDLRLRYPEVRFASAQAVLGEVMPLISSDGLRVTGLALLGLVIGVLIIGRSVRRVSLVLLSVCMAVATTASLMSFFGWKVNLYNMLVFPVAFGLGVDGAIFMVWSVYRRRGVTDWSMIHVSSQAVLGATMTTLVAFASLIVSSNLGLVSMGQLATLALGMTLVMNLVWLPAALSVVHWRAQKRGQLVPMPSPQNPFGGDAAPAEGSSEVAAASKPDVAGVDEKV